MTWVKLDDAIWRHPKLRKIPRDQRGPALALYVGVLCHCAEQLTDGVFSEETVREVAFSIGVSRPNVTRKHLTTAGLWDIEEGQLQVHDYLEYNDDAATIKQRRKLDAKRKKEERAKRTSHGNPGGRPAGQPKDVLKESDPPPRVRAQTRPVPSSDPVRGGGGRESLEDTSAAPALRGSAALANGRPAADVALTEAELAVKEGRWRDPDLRESLAADYPALDDARLDYLVVLAGDLEAEEQL